MLKKFFLLSVGAFVLFTAFNANGFTLEKGTISVGGASTLSAQNSDSDRFDSSNSIGASVAMGYFIMDNFELGGEVSANYTDRDRGDFKGFSISPFATYHFDLNETSNIYLTGMLGIVRSYSDYGDHSSEGEGTLFSSEIGWEYRFTPSVVGTIGFRYAKEDVDYDIKGSNLQVDDSDTSTSFGTVLGFKIFF